MDDLSMILHEAKYKQAMLDLKRRPIRRIPDLPRTKSSRKLIDENEVDLHSLVKEPVGVWFLRRFADLDFKLERAFEGLALATEDEAPSEDGSDEDKSYADDSSVHGLPDQHESTFLKFVNAFYARKRADPSNSVPRSVVVMLIRHYDLEQLEPVLRGLSNHGFDPAAQETLAVALDEAMERDPRLAPSYSRLLDDEDDVIGEDDANADRGDTPVPEILRKASTIVDVLDDEDGPLIIPRPRRLLGSVGSVEFVAAQEEAFGGLPDHEDPEHSDGHCDNADVDDEGGQVVDPDAYVDEADDEDEDEVHSLADNEEVDVELGAPRVKDTHRRRFSSTYTELQLANAASRLRRANSINQQRAQERRRQITSLRKLHSERTIGLNEAVEALIYTVCEPIFQRFFAHKYAVRQYCRVKSFVQRPAQDGHFSKLRVLGRGATGRVYACMHMHTGRPMAMKVMPKKLVKFRRTTSQVKAERRVLEALARKPSPYCMRLLYAYQTKESFHFILPLAIAGDLRYHLSQGPLPKKRALVYSAEVANGLGHLHSLGYVMRDLKPRNILLDAQGRCRISDFGLAVNVGSGTLIRGRAGTVGYWSPQVLGGERYGQDADWWSYGVCVYEFFAGFNPFSRRFTGYSSRNEATLHAPVRFPPGFSKKVATFVLRLLERDVPRRLGCQGRGADEVLDEDHAIWKQLDLEAVRTATHRSVWVPLTGVVYAESESEIAANEERKLPDVHKVKVNPGDMPPFDDFVAEFDHMTDVARVLGFHVDDKVLQADVLAKYRRGKIPRDPALGDGSADLLARPNTNSKCAVM